MTNYEFKVEYDKLVENFPKVFGNAAKEMAIGTVVSGLDCKWWKSLVAEILASNDPWKTNIEARARGERLDKIRSRTVLEHSAELAALGKNSNLENYKKKLDELGVSSFADLIGKKPTTEDSK